MKRIFSKTAFSLLELIIASVLVVVVILGIFGINNVLSNNNQDYGQRYLVKSATQTTLNNILNNASLAVGSGTTINGYSDKGILQPTEVTSPGDNNSFCIHQSPSGVPGSASDQWLCYTWFINTDPSYPNQIRYCTMPYSISFSNRGAAGCNSTPALLSTSTYLGTAFAAPTVSFSTAVGSQMTFSVTIQNCLNNTPPPAGTCNFAYPGGSSDPSTNPGVTVSGTVVPSQEGMQQS